MKKILFFIILIIGVVQVSIGQDDDVEWETQTFVTGYFALNGEYVDLPVFKDVKGKNMGVGIAEASVLTIIQPLEKLKINTVVTYKPRLHINGMITELSGEWSFSEAVNLKAGRFLLPLHPANTQYYATVNKGIALPIFVTNHALFPLNINGVNINGDIFISDNFSLCYSFSGGQYTKMTREEAGVLGFFGRDGVYMNENVQQVNSMITKIETSHDGGFDDYFGTGGKLCFVVGDFLKFGSAAFYTKFNEQKQFDETTSFTTEYEQFNYGVNLILEIGDMKAKGSMWLGSETPVDVQHFDPYTIELYYGEVEYTFNTITPFVKYEKIYGRMKDWQRASFGINYRPLFETTFKLEYHRYLQNYVDDFNIFQFSIIYSF